MASSCLSHLPRLRLPAQVLSVREAAALQGIWAVDFPALMTWSADRALANTLQDMCGNAFTSTVSLAVCLAVMVVLSDVRPLQRLCHGDE